MSIFEIEIASIFSVFAIWFCIIYLPSFFVLYGWLYSENQSIFEIEIASTFSVFAIWFCIYTCLRSLYSMTGCIQNHRTHGRTELSSTD